MDPITLKLIQLILTSIFGGVAIVFGFILFLKGISGKSDIIIQSKDFKGKITNAAPGVFLFMAGVAIIYWSVNKQIEKTDKETISTTSNGNALDTWLNNSQKVADKTSYGEMLNMIFPAGGMNNKSISLTQDLTLQQISNQVYNDGKYWKLLAVFNKDRGYYNFDSVSQNTVIAKGNLIEYFTPAKFEHTVQRETILKIRGKDLQKIYDELLKYTDTATNVQSIESLRALERNIKDNYELSVAYQFVTVSEELTLDELSLKYYQDKKYYKIIQKFNNLSSLERKENIPLETQLMIPYINP